MTRREGRAAVELRLRELRDADLDALFAWESDPAGVEMAAFTRSDPSDRAAFDAHYGKVRAEPSNLMLVIEQAGVLVGAISSFWIDGDREVSYWIAPERWGQGIASVALADFLRIEQTRPLYGRVSETNPGSRSVLEKNGFVQIGQEISFATGLARDVTEYIYRLTA